MLKKTANPIRGQTAIEYVMMIWSGRPWGVRVGSDGRSGHRNVQPPLARFSFAMLPHATSLPTAAPRPPVRGQTAIEYVMMISATVLFISLVAFFIKTRVIAP